MLLRAASLLAFALLLSLRTTAAPEADPLADELKQRDDAWVRDEFNLTHGMRLTACAPGKPIESTFLFPEAGERTVRVWMAVRAGEAKVRLLGPAGEVELLLEGARVEGGFTRVLPAGKHTLEISCALPLQGDALLGIKGSAVAGCRLDAARVQEIAASPASGFYWPYLLFIPAQVKSPHLLVAPNNTGFGTDDVELLRASGSCDVRRESALATALGVPLLVPLFPRPPKSLAAESLYLHALTRAALTVGKPEWKRVDLQLIAMLHDARARLQKSGIEAGERALLTGFSAAGSFVDRFAMLHPEQVLAVAVGSPGGWPLAPLAKLDGDALPYPVGLGEVKALTGSEPNPAALREVRWFFYLGDADENDAVIHRDSFSLADEALIQRRFGATPVARWMRAEALYRQAGLQAEFHLYKNVAHEQTAESRADVQRFFEKTIQIKSTHDGGP